MAAVGGQGTFPICPAFEAHASKPVIHHLNRNVHALARSRGDDNVFKNRGHFWLDTKPSGSDGVFENLAAIITPKTEEIPDVR